MQPKLYIEYLKYPPQNVHVYLILQFTREYFIVYIF